MPPLLIIGASCRAAAWSASRAGYQITTLDLFADRDTSEMTDCHTIRSFPDSIVEQAEEFRNHRIVLAGGMENFPSIVAELEKRHTIIGPNAQQIVALRSLDNLQQWTRQAGIADILFPLTIDDPKLLERIHPIEESSPDSTLLASSSRLRNRSTEAIPKTRWLRKSTSSAGGLGVGYWYGDLELDFTQNYLQEKIEGECLGVVVRCTTDGAQFIGATRNRTYKDFMYGGSEGPIVLSSEKIQSIERLMRTIATAIGYVGLLQADFVLASTGRLYLLEVNPRWSAGLEVLELASERCLMADYLGEKPDQTDVANASLAATFYVKHIWYAPSSGIVSPMLSDWLMARAYHHPSCPPFGWADIPKANIHVSQGQPIATLIARFKHCSLEATASLIHRLELEATQIFIRS